MLTYQPRVLASRPVSLINHGRNVYGETSMSYWIRGLPVERAACGMHLIYGNKPSESLDRGL